MDQFHSPEPGVHQPQSAPMPAAPVRHASFGELFARAVAIWKVQWWRLAVVGLVPALVAVAFGALGLVGGALLLPFFLKGGTIVWVVGALAMAAVVFFIWFSARLSVTQIQLVFGADARIGLHEAWRKTKGLAWPFVLVGALTSLVVSGGFLLLIVPGIIWAVSFVFAPYVMVKDGVRGRDALVRSRQLVKGDWGWVFFTFLVFGILMLLISGAFSLLGNAFDKGSIAKVVVGVLSGLLNLLVLSPLGLGFIVAVFESLSARKSATLVPMPRAKRVYTIAMVLGLWPLILILLLFIASTFLRSVRMKAALKRQAAMQTITEFESVELKRVEQRVNETEGAGATDPEADSDNDGLPNQYEEGLLGTHSDNPDSDGDGLADGDDFRLGLSATKFDTDGDGYKDGDEIVGGFDPKAYGKPLPEETRARLVEWYSKGELHEPTITTLRPLFK